MPACNLQDLVLFPVRNACSVCCATLQFLRRVQYLFAIYLRYRAPALSRATESWLFHVSDPPISGITYMYFRNIIGLDLTLFVPPTTASKS